MDPVEAEPPFDYSPLPAREPIAWPNGARIAFYVGLNVEHYRLDAPSASIFPGTASLVPDPLNYGWRDYGPRVGIWRMIELFDELGIRPSALLNAAACARYPQIVEAGRERGWAWVAHGRTNSEFHSGFDSTEAERDALTEMLDALEESTGQRPAGWLGPALTETFETPSLLAELGASYVLDWCNDDQPYPLRGEHGRMISVPYSIELNDMTSFLSKSYTGPEFARMIIDACEQLCLEAGDSGRVLMVALHPFITGQPFRHRYLAEALEQVVGRDDVWVTTSDEIAAHYLDHHYDAAVAALESD